MRAFGATRAVRVTKTRLLLLVKAGFPGGQGQAPWNRLGHSQAAPSSRRQDGEPRSASPGRPLQHAAGYGYPGR